MDHQYLCKIQYTIVHFNSRTESQRRLNAGNSGLIKPASSSERLCFKKIMLSSYLGSCSVLTSDLLPPKYLKTQKHRYRHKYHHTQGLGRDLATTHCPSMQLPNRTVSVNNRNYPAVGIFLMQTDFNILVAASLLWGITGKRLFSVTCWPYSRLL